MIAAGLTRRSSAAASGTATAIAGSASPWARYIGTGSMPGGKSDETTETVLGTATIAKGNASAMSRRSSPSPTEAGSTRDDPTGGTATAWERWNGGTAM
ncbi:hypothetical protein Ssi02_74840 [Sinosporangium siamense]|uniref:Uncharacterized protein n=1 Tax=Sinosporangium siamense TaxID=1367973 RepID=A0A919RPB1_9ACTN|nr:hypothetical protein Ssi02_74840 [Sinosporangium siamense]